MRPRTAFALTSDRPTPAQAVPVCPRDSGGSQLARPAVQHRAGHMRRHPVASPSAESRTGRRGPGVRVGHVHRRTGLRQRRPWNHARSDALLLGPGIRGGPAERARRGRGACRRLRECGLLPHLSRRRSPPGHDLPDALGGHRLLVVRRERRPDRRREHCGLGGAGSLQHRRACRPAPPPSRRPRHR